MADLGYRVKPVPCLEDNFAYLLIDNQSQTCAAVDPVEPTKVCKAADAEKVKITHVLTTHKHGDHSGGNLEMKRRFPDLEVIGGADDLVPGVTRPVKHGDKIKIGATTVDVLHTPCHTRGHVLYVASAEGTEAKSLFCGDTLFIGGCGRFFEGAAHEMHAALNTHITGLPPSTLVWCGHEYTVANLMFAASVEPNSTVIKHKTKWAQEQRANGKNTIPSTVGEEMTFNPFMRVDQPEVQAYAGKRWERNSRSTHSCALSSRMIPGFT
eukprot:541730_1